MTARRLTIQVVHSAVLVAGTALVALAVACASPTAPTAAGAAPSAARNGSTPAAHGLCGVLAGSDQHC